MVNGGKPIFEFRQVLQFVMLPRKLANNQPCPRRKGSPTSMGPVDNTTAFRWLKSDRGPKPNEQLVTGFRYTYSLVQSFS